jgi:hypothetical protein
VRERLATSAGVASAIVCATQVSLIQSSTKNALTAEEWTVTIQKVEISIQEIVCTVETPELMASATQTNHFYFQTQRKEAGGYDSGNGETANDRSFDSVMNASNMRDQTIQQGDGTIRRPRSNRPAIPGAQRKWSEPYISPYVLLAEQRARERTAQRKRQLAQQQRERPAWDDHAAPSGSLFDPTIHKQEIFKLKPRNNAQEGLAEHSREVTRGIPKQRAPIKHVAHQENDMVNFKPNGWSRMTIKTSGVSTMCNVVGSI